MAHASRLYRFVAVLVIGVPLSASTAVARGTLPVEAPRPGLSARARVAVERSIGLLQRTAAEYRRQRECFACHHQALPVLALVEAQKCGFVIDASDLQAQLDHTAAHLLRGRDGYREGRGQGGQADTAGWALWALEAGGRPADEMTAATCHYLLSWQGDLGHWRSSSKQRPPTQGSEFTTTYLALRGLEAFGMPEEREGIAARREKAVEWLRETKADDTEDRVYRLRSLFYVGEDSDEAAGELLASQRADGGWAQREEMESDAYATGSALAALHETGHLSAGDASYRRGVEFLLRTQLADGSWHVVTRSKPVQVYFESGFPHGKDQFVSAAATSWGVMALLAVCRDK